MRSEDGGGICDPVTFEEKRAFLESGAPWPDEPPPECIETHASVVFLTRDRAWKLKKPVHLIHVDQRSPEARERLCREEIRVNRELAGRVYIGLTPIVQHPDGPLALGGAGRVVDWVIESVRLPAAQMLDRRLGRGPAPGAEEIGALGDVLVGFYRGRRPERGSGDAFFERLVRDSRIAADHLREMGPAAGVAVPGRVLDGAVPTIRRCGAEILDRARRGLLVEGHGDLRAEHVCLTEPPVVFDRLEIDSSLRIIDPFFEVNALGLECGLMGAEWIGAHLLDRLAGDFEPPSDKLMTAYGIVLSLTRARFAVDHFRDSVLREPAKYRAKAEDYLSVATRLSGDEPSGP